MSRRSVLFIVVTVTQLAPFAVGDLIPGPKSGVYASDRGEYWAKLDVADWETATATLFDYREELVQEGGDTRFKYHERTLWKLDLGYVPDRLLVSNRGWVVGVNRYANLGYDHSIVVWNRDGAKLADYKLDDLLTPDEIGAFVMHSTSSRHWDGDARFMFEHDGYLGKYDRLIIQLEWGKIITVDLRTGALTFTDPASSLPTPMSGFADEAVFVFFKKNQPVGEVACSWKSDGNVKCNGTAPRGLNSDLYQLTVVPDETGRWKRFELQFGDYHTGMVRDETLVRRLSTRGGCAAVICGPTSTDQPHAPASSPARLLSPRSELCTGHQAPVMWSQLIRLYDREKGGGQPFVRLSSDASEYRGELRLIDTKTRLVKGREMEFDRYLVYTSTIWADRSAKVYMIEGPDHETFCVRKGYEALREP